MFLTYDRFMPVKPMQIFYKPDGTGRDNYIRCDSGGLVKARRVETKFDPGSFYVSRSQSAPRNTAPRMDGKACTYTTNGSGRDTYISSNAGGFRKSYGQLNFIESLRVNDKIRPTSAFKKNDHFMRYQHQVLLPKEKRNEDMRKSMVTTMVDRLSQPKSYGKQYNNTSHTDYTNTRSQSAMGRFRAGEEASPVGIQGRPSSRAQSRRESRVESRPESRIGNISNLIPSSAKNASTGRTSPIGAYASIKAMTQQRPNSSRADQRSMRQRDRL